MTYVQLFLHFWKIGCVSFGGGFGMISLIRETVLHNHWLTEEEFAAFIALSESTPGPLAVNIATLTGAAQGGMAGAFFATLGVVSPAFLIMLVIAALMNNLTKSVGLKAFLMAVRPCIAALVLATAVTMGFDTFCGFEHIRDAFIPDFSSICTFCTLVCVCAATKARRHKPPSPIIMIALSAVLGILFS